MRPATQIHAPGCASRRLSPSRSARAVAGLGVWLGLAAAAPAQNGVDFVRDIAPILQQRCVSCHGPAKHKGDLRLDRKEHLFGDDAEAGTVLPGKPDESELLRRLLLPAGDEEVMPNEGPRLTDAQIELVRQWIVAGADWPASGDEYFVAAAERAKVPHFDFGIAAPAADVQAAIDAALVALADRGVHAQRVAADTPAIDVNASLLGAAFTDADLELLRPLAPVLVWLNLARTSVSDAGLKALAGLPELRRLNLATSGIGDAGLAALGDLPRLEVLNVYGSKVGDDGVRGLARWPRLQKVYAFDTAVTAAGATALAAAREGLVVDRGDYAEQRLLAAQAEIAEREANKQKPVNTKCPVSGDSIVGDQFVDHDGLRIAFCCGKCKKRFTDEPQAFAAKIAEFKEAAAKAGDAGKAEGAK